MQNNVIFDIEKIIDLLQTGQKPKIAVLGDFCLDKYLYHESDLDERSVETGRIARQIRGKRMFAGVGGTITANLIALGADVFCLGIIGNDGEGFDLLNALHTLGADLQGMVSTSEVYTNTYMKSILHDHSGWTEEDRIDIRSANSVSDQLTDTLRVNLEGILPDLNAVIITDQFLDGTGSLMTDSLRTAMGMLQKKYPEVFFICDSRFNLDLYSGIMVKCNAGELIDCCTSAIRKGLKKATDVDSDADNRMEEIRHSAVWMVQKTGKPVLVTRGAKGSLLFEPGPELIETVIPAQKVNPPIDICGAGDATNAALTFGHSIGMTLPESAFLAGVASAITIRKIGETGTASCEEIIRVLRQ